MTECRGCIEKGREPRCWVEHPNDVCCDCAYPTPEDRQRALLAARRGAEASRESLRDRFAMAALTGLSARRSLEQSDRFPDPVADIVALAFEFADKAMKQRQPSDEDR